MKQLRLSLICGAICLGLAACAHGAQQEAELPPASSAVFETLQATGGEIISADFSIAPDEGFSNFLYIQATKDTTAEFTYTFTKDAGDTSIGYYTEGKTEPTEIPLDSAAVTTKTENQITVPLEKGMNIFYITGSQNQCSVHCELSGFSIESISYSGTALPETAK